MITNEDPKAYMRAWNRYISRLDDLHYLANRENAEKIRVAQRILESVILSNTKKIIRMKKVNK